MNIPRSSRSTQTGRTTTKQDPSIRWVAADAKQKQAVLDAVLGALPPKAGGQLRVRPASIQNRQMWGGNREVKFTADMVVSGFTGKASVVGEPKQFTGVYHPATKKVSDVREVT